MKVLVIGPSEIRSKGGMAAVIRGIRESRLLIEEFEIDSFPSCIDGSLPVRLFYSAYGYLRFLFCYKKYDLFHIHTAEKGSTFRKALYLRKVKRAGKKGILHIHGAEYLPFYDRLDKRRKKLVDDFFGQADLVLALSDSWKRELESRFHMKDCRTLYNGIDPFEFRAAATDVAERRNSFLMLGRLGERKGAYDLIDAVGRAVLQNPKLTVCMAGDGEVKKLRALVAARGLQKNISIPGWIDREEKLKRLQDAGTVVLPSYHEGLPMSILEGMAAGKAILSTPVGAIPEVVTAENGILVEPGDRLALAEGLLRCSGDVEMLKSMSRNNIEKIKAIFSIDRMHELLAECYRQAAK